MSHSTEARHYDVPNHAAKLAATKEFADLCKRYGVTVEAALPRLAAEVKRLVNENAAQELGAYEFAIARTALELLGSKLDDEKKAAETETAVQYRRQHPEFVKHVHQPRTYSLPDHLARLVATDAFKALAKEHNTRPDELQYRLEADLKVCVEANRKYQIEAFELGIGTAALADLEAKLKIEGEAAA